VTATGRSLADQAARTFNDALGDATAAGRGFADQAAYTLSDAKHGVVAARQRSQSAVLDFVDKNPLLVAGIGAAIGAFIAASLPSSNAENQMFGSRADDLKDEVRDAASRGLEQAKGFAADVAGDVAAAAAREGLDGRGMQQAAETVTKGLKSVAQRGVNAALGDTSLAPEIQTS